MSSKLETLNRWVDDVARLTQPDRIHWCNGSEAEYDELVELMLVDQNSADGSVEFVQQRFPQVRVHQTGRNLGFAGGNQIPTEADERRGKFNHTGFIIHTE